MDDELAAETLEAYAAIVVRQRAATELAELGVKASPADVETWLAAGPKQRKAFTTQWAVTVATPEAAWKKPKELET